MNQAAILFSFYPSVRCRALETQSMTIFGRHVLNYVTIITSLSHFYHVFKMVEIADEPDEYFSDEERGQL